MATTEHSIDRSNLPIHTALNVMRRTGGRIRRALMRTPSRMVVAGIPASWFGYRWMREESVQDYFARRGNKASRCESYETLDPETTAANALPRNVADRERLPKERGWWGYSFYDVPARTSAETFCARIENCRLYFFFEPRKNNFYPCIVTKDDRALKLREIAFRPLHGATIRSGKTPMRVERATWILERVYHNHSHWLTAHLPKLCLLKSRGAIQNVLLPQRLSPVMEASLRMLDLDPDEFRRFDPGRPLEVTELTVLGTDRFRPELLRPVREAFRKDGDRKPWRRIFISRARSQGRKLLNEDDLWPLLRDAGFELVFMEELDFPAQVRLMGETAVLLAPHGAGLTNMMFCPEGTHIVEIADLTFPNPNFYALASAMGHHYWLISGQAIGEVHPLEKDLTVPPSAVANVLDQLTATCRALDS